MASTKLLTDRLAYAGGGGYFVDGLEEEKNGLRAKKRAGRHRVNSHRVKQQGKAKMQLHSS